MISVDHIERQCAGIPYTRNRDHVTNWAKISMHDECQRAEFSGVRKVARRDIPTEVADIVLGIDEDPSEKCKCLDFEQGAILANTVDAERLLHQSALATRLVAIPGERNLSNKSHVVQLQRGQILRAPCSHSHIYGSGRMSVTMKRSTDTEKAGDVQFSGHNQARLV